MENNKEDSKTPEINSETTKTLSEILDTTVPEPLPSTSQNTNRSNFITGNVQDNINPHQPTTRPDKRANTPAAAIHTSTPSTNRQCDETVSENSPFEPRTVKELLTEILDCTVVRKPILQPTPLQLNERNIDSASRVVPEYVLDPKLITGQLFNVRCNSDESACSRMQWTVKEALNEILDYSIFKRSIQAAPCNRPPSVNENRPGTSRPRPEYLSQGELGGNQREHQIYRAIGGGTIKSTSALQSPSAKSLGKMLPSYSTVMRLGPPPRIKSFHSSGSFIPRQPPPSYAEVEGLWEDNPSMISSESVVFGPDPTYMVCPRCRAVVVTDIQTERSNMTHIIALVMCLCLCWPCCLLPYCLRSCNYTYHSCPNCRHYFGMYRPF